jgi:uncharacterized peroxidase-related enzyme
VIEDQNEADALVHAIVRDWRTAPLSAADKALCSYAEKLTLHQDEIEKADIDILRSQGFDDRAIHDATQVIAFFNYITRVANGLGVEPEDWIQPWGVDELGDMS